MTSEPIKSGGVPGGGEEEAYLWDRSGPGDPLVERLERELGQFRDKSVAPEMPEADPVVGRIGFGRTRWVAAAAAVVVVGAAVAWMAWPRPSWEMKALEGSPMVRGSAVSGTSRLRAGDRLATDAGSRASLAVGDIGTVTVDPGSRLRLLKARKGEQRLELTRGTIHAVINAPARIFIVDTPAGVATDLGCRYTLAVDGADGTLLNVTMGMVELSALGLEATVPKGAWCRMDRGRVPGAPWFEDAPAALIGALETYELKKGGTPELEIILASARAKDSLTLWHLLARVSDGERPAVVDRLAAFVPMPPGAMRAAVLRLDKGALDAWWTRVPDTW